MSILFLYFRKFEMKIEPYLKAGTYESTRGCHRVSCTLQISFLTILRARYTLFPIGGRARAIVEIVYEFVFLSGERTHDGLADAVILRRLRRRSIFRAWDHYRQRAITLFIVDWYYYRDVKYECERDRLKYNK